jgi:hypothetical protein
MDMLTGIYQPRRVNIFEDSDFSTRVEAVRLRLSWLDLTDERYSLIAKVDQVKLAVQEILVSFVMVIE